MRLAVIELHDAGQRLFALLAKAPGVTLHCPARVVDVIRTAERAEVLLDNGQRLCGQLLVAADGSRSALAQACNVQWRQEEYSQFATIANVTTAEDPQGRAFERFTRYGPLALLPMSQGRSSLVWCHAREIAPGWMHGTTSVLSPSCNRPSAGGWGVSSRPVNGTVIRSAC